MCWKVLYAKRMTFRSCYINVNIFSIDFDRIHGNISHSVLCINKARNQTDISEIQWHFLSKFMCFVTHSNNL